MEAPEKLYVDVHDNLSDSILYGFTQKHKDGDIEYTCTDAFIEKACEYFHRGLEDTKVIDDYRNILVRGIQASYTSVEEFIEDFIKYMEGE